MCEMSKHSIAAGGVGRQRQNLEKIRVQGVELSAMWQVAKSLSVTADYIFNDARVHERSQWWSGARAIASGRALTTLNSYIVQKFGSDNLFLRKAEGPLLASLGILSEGL